MIQANELRVNNWFINSQGKFEQVRELYDGRVNPDVSMHFQEIEGDTFEQIKPIPLTPEILPKCGMTKDNYWENCYLFTENEGMFSFEWKNDALVMYVGNTLEYESGPDVKYVHQLQNLYFALTGEELKIEL